MNNLIGYETEDLKVIAEGTPRRYGKRNNLFRYWVCECKHCGNNTFETTSNYIMSKRVRSCGCISKKLTWEKREHHGMFGTRIYREWAHIISRCENDNVKEYKNYGGRGIKVCVEWKDFNNFYEWAMSNGYTDELTIDRIDNDGDYEPNNCRFVDTRTQARNRRNTVKVNIDGDVKPLAEWCEIYNIPYKTAYGRIFGKGWESKTALTQPRYARKRGK